MTADELRTPFGVTLATLAALALLVGGAWGDGLLSTRAAQGALAGLAVGAAVLATAYVAHTTSQRLRGETDA